LSRPENGQLALTNLLLEEVPPDILVWTELEVLRLEDNRIRTLPAQLAALTRLTELGLWHNRLTSILPPQPEEGSKDDEDDKEEHGTPLAAPRQRKWCASTRATV